MSAKSCHILLVIKVALLITIQADNAGFSCANLKTAAIWAIRVVTIERASSSPHHPLL
jgi:hypothetical protein